MTSDEVAKIAQQWPSLNNKQRSRLIGKMTDAEKLKLRQAIREMKRHPVKNPSPQKTTIPSPGTILK
jgi:hypothetical protein